MVSGLISSAGLQNLVFYDVYGSCGVVAVDRRANFSPIWTEIVILFAYLVEKAVILRDRKFNFLPSIVQGQHMYGICEEV